MTSKATNASQMVWNGANGVSAVMCPHEWEEIIPASPGFRSWKCKCGAYQGRAINLAQGAPKDAP